MTGITFDILDYEKRAAFFSRFQVRGKSRVLLPDVVNLNMRNADDKVVPRACRRVTARAYPAGL